MSDNLAVTEEQVEQSEVQTPMQMDMLPPIQMDAVPPDRMISPQTFAAHTTVEPLAGDITPLVPLTHEEQMGYFKNTLLATERPGMEDLILFAEDLGFFTAPASGGNHLCKEGGLLEHTTNVMRFAERVGTMFLGGEAYRKISDSVMIAAALHDLGKCGREGQAYYVENLIKDGRPTKAHPEQKYKRSEAKPYETNKNLCHIDHPLRSVELAARFIDLTEEEEHAIFYHDGAYGCLAYDLKGHEQPIQVIVHFADFWSAQFYEKNKLDKFYESEEK